LQEINTFGASEEAAREIASEAKTSSSGITKSTWVQEVETYVPYTKPHRKHGKRGKNKTHGTKPAKGPTEDPDGVFEA